MDGRVPPAPIELLRALAALAEPPGPEHEGLARALGLPGSPTAAQFAETFVLQLHPYASVHLGPEGMLGGEARERVAGFWRAVGRTPPVEPDHLGALLALYAALLEEAGRLAGAEAAITGGAAAALLHEHLAGWVFGFLDAVAEAGDGYAGWARLTARVLAGEVGRGPRPEGLPVHLAEAPPLPDPRVEGGGDFLAGLLAPVRSGMIVTRASLTRTARTLDLGLRVGERRYVLEHLLAQAAPEVLGALADEAERARERHAARRELLGAVAAFGEGRAARCSELLRDLAAQGAEATLVGEGSP